MIASFFRRLDDDGVDWLLISGQATILYGAATFSEDVDLWVRPTGDNFARFTAALHASGARHYKLSPPFTLDVAQRRHGFHFTLAGLDAGADVYLDVMGFPPRVGSFEAAAIGATAFDTEWGRLRTIGIKELVEIKKTQRPRDYPIISRLALAFLDQRRTTGVVTHGDLAWAREQIFTVAAFKRWVVEHAAARGVLTDDTLLLHACTQMQATGELELAVEDELDAAFERRSAPLRKADRHYWRPVLDELKAMRARGELMPEGAPV